MPAPSTADQFLDLVSKSGLIDPQSLQAYLQRLGAAGTLPEAPQVLADAMVRDGLLTRFQVDQFLRGKWRNFILCGKYKILGPLGSGGMGLVYLCEHQVMRRRVAVKVLPARPDDPDALERFRREARAVAQLNHTNIVGGHDIDRDGKLHFLVMEYIDGSTFHAIVNNCGPMTPLRASHYIRQAALGLQHAHEAGLVHRDIKPANLLLDRTGTVKILDLGLARFFHDDSDDLSKRQLESPVGTSDFMAPEQAMDSHRVDIRADIYSLGATFYYLLAGHGPFQGRTSFQKLYCHQFEQPKPIRDIRPDVPKGLAGIVERMMAKEPAERHQTPAEVAEALAPWTQTAIPPPPREEMPKLAAPARDRKHAEAAAGLPASLYALASVPEGAIGPEGGATPLSGSEAPTTPVEKVADGLQTAQPPRVGLGGATAVTAVARGRQPTPPGDEEDSNQMRPPPAKNRRLIMIAAGAIVLLVAVAAGIAVHQLINSKGTAKDGGQPALQPVATENSTRLRLLVPAYFYPADEGLAQWDRVIDSRAAAITVAIANPNSGPGEIADPNYTKVLERAKRKGVTVIGYVSTKYGKRRIGGVKKDVDRWIALYPSIQGIFFDEQATSADQVHYYAALYDYVRKDRSLPFVVTNPGAPCVEDYFAKPASDIGCLVEVAKGFSMYHRPGWTDRYTAGRFAVLECETETSAKMQEYVHQMADKKIGFCYITDAKEPNPWNRLPAYWEAEVEAVLQVNGPN
jgi:hypothetical protein